MKTAKPALQASTQDECGIWLDTVQLKDKAKRKKLAHPISKLLNPLAKGDGYSLAVALNFTQTKMQMPNTKQSSISSYFAPQRRVLTKMSTSEELNKVVVDPSASITAKCTSPTATLMAFGTKRPREQDLQVPHLHNTEEHLAMSSLTDFKQEPSGCKQKSEDTIYKDSHEESDTTPLFNIHYESEEDEEEVKEPEKKRRITEALSPMVKGDPLGDQCNKDQQKTYGCPQSNQNIPDPRERIQWDFITQDYESQLDLTDREQPMVRQDRNSTTAFIEILQTEEGFGKWLAVERKTSTQKELQCNSTSWVEEKKDNNVFPTSPYDCSLNYKCAEPNMLSPQYRIPLRKEELLNPLHNRTKANASPLKMGAVRRARVAVEEDSLAVLFTQDSEGFKVIAHRGLLARSPLKDQTKSGSGKENRAVPCTSFSDYEDEEILFTQDTQGNMVIKH